MKAETVFEIYKALEHQEQDRLYDLVKTHFKSKYNFNKSKKIKDFLTSQRSPMVMILSLYLTGNEQHSLLPVVQ